MSTCRLLPLTSANGPTNMGLDEALLRSAVERGVASLRFYTWSAATLSLGYFQPHAPARQYPGLAELPWLRRPTGGDALIHHHEVTYALALPPGASWQGVTPWSQRFHRILRSALAELGVSTHLCEGEEAQKHGEVLCFLHLTPGDLILAGHKIVGSAQRKARGALLQHGGILLARSPHTPELPGIAELSGIDLTAPVVADAARRAFVAETGWELAAEEFTGDEGKYGAELAAERYRDAGWNAKR
jgi:lipoyl(octanoyl) transferase